VIALGKAARRVLWRYLAEREDGEEPGAPLFLVKYDRPMNKNALRLIIVHLGQKAGVKKCHPHRFRHTFALTYLRADTDQVFVGKRGALTQNAVQRQLAEIGRRAKVDLTPHVLRHSFAKNLINAKVSMEKVAALLGHSILNTTRLCTLPSQADLAEATEVLEG
jgi:site-specific recombinase XerD